MHTKPRRSASSLGGGPERNDAILEGTMKWLLMYVPTIIISGALAAILAISAVHHSQIVVGSPNSDAAFRDGMFLGRLDADRSRKPHLACGRWRTDADRHSFVSGYVEAYRERQGEDASGQLGYRQAAEQRGYYDGVADGLQQHRESMPFQANATANYRRADQGYSESNGDLTHYKQAYREAYGTGYQQGYYGETDKIATAALGGPDGPE